MKRVLLTSASGTLAHGITRGLRAAPEPIYIIGADSSRYHMFQSEADELHILPRANDPSYVDILSQIAVETKADFIWPAHDAEVGLLSEVAGDLPCRTWLPPPHVVASCIDKMATYTRLSEAGVPVPETVLVNIPDDLGSALRQFDGDIWLRARNGAGATGAYHATSLDHATFWLDIHGGWGRFTAAEVLPGTTEYGWESIWKDGRLIAGQDETRLVRGNTGISLPGVQNRGVLLKSAPGAYRAVAEQAVRAIMPEPNGLFRVDMVADAAGIPRVTEVDAGRFGAGGVANWYEFGYNWAYEALRLGFDEPVNYVTPLINPCPSDMASITGFNRDITFIKMSDVESKAREYEARQSRT